MGYYAKVSREGVHPIQIAHPLYMGATGDYSNSHKGGWSGVTYLSITTMKREPLVGAIMPSIYLRPTVTPRMRIPRLRGTPAGGARFLDRMSRGVAPKTPGYQWIPLSPTTPLGCRTDCLTGKCDTLAGSPEKGISARRPARGRRVGMGLCTSVTASQMTDAYGASTLRVPHR